MNPKRFYRIEEQWRVCQSLTEWGECEFGMMRLDLVVKTYHEIKKTPKGSWIRSGNPGDRIYLAPDRWVSDTAKKRFAYPTREQAWQSFVARKQRQIALLERQSRNACHALELAHNMKENLIHN